MVVRRVTFDGKEEVVAPSPGQGSMKKVPQSHLDVSKADRNAIRAQFDERMADPGSVAWCIVNGIFIGRMQAIENPTTLKWKKPRTIAQRKPRASSSKRTKQTEEVGGSEPST